MGHEVVDEKAHDGPKDEEAEHHAHAAHGSLDASVDDFLSGAAAVEAAPEAVDAPPADPFNGAFVAKVDLLVAEPAGLIESYFSLERGRGGPGCRHEALFGRSRGLALGRESLGLWPV